MPGTEYDLIVVGAGSTGENVAGRAVAAGLSAVVVEAELVGGDCSYWACMPSKALLRSPDALRAARAVDGARQAVTGELDVAAVLRRRDSFTSHWKDDGQVSWLDSAGIDLVRGVGRLAGPRRVEVQSGDGSTTTLVARHAVALCTGSEAVIPPVPGLAEAEPWTSREATSAQQIPRRLVVLGGGVVGCELATAFRALGSEQVTLIQRGPRLLPALEPFAGERVLASLTELGVDVRLGSQLTEVQGTGPHTLTLDDGSTLEADRLLVATGRKPRSADLGLETVGLEPDTWLAVDDTLRVTAVEEGWLYAAGDANHRALLTHMGKYQARACGDVVAARARGDADAASPGAWSRYAATADAAAVPQVVFTDPEVAAVGMTEAQARERGLDVRLVTYELGNVAGASLYADGYAGLAGMLVDEARHVIVGATFVGPAVGDLLHAATVAIVGEVPLERLWHAVPSYPTTSEIWLRLLETYGL
ncbi:MAG: NAD(P)/FAD-dependent oxidoreductase [Actinomycetota bacterium]|nr:NAD(P)/FAD-dependent oxidoreductase [Actinomycetota bacterium]